MCSDGGVSLLAKALVELAGADLTAIPDRALRDEILALGTALNQLTALIATRVGSFDARRLSDDDGCRTTRSWLTAFGRLSQGAATGVLSRARLLRELPSLAAAAAAGAVSAEHLHKVEQLAHRVGLDEIKPTDQTLASQAAVGTPMELQKVCERIADHLDPDGKPPADSDFDKRELSLHRIGSLMYIKGRLDAEGGAAVVTAL